MTDHLPSRPPVEPPELVEWLASGPGTGMLRLRGRRQPSISAEAPVLALSAAHGVRRFSSLRDVRADPGIWRAAYLLDTELVRSAQEMRLEWPDGLRLSLPVRGLLDRHAEEPPAAPATASEGEVIDRAVLAERRAQRAESAQRAQAKAAADALQALAALEARLEQLTAERDALAAGQGGRLPSGSPPPPVRLLAGDRPAQEDELRRQLDEARASTRRAEQRHAQQGGALAGALSALARLRREVAELRLRLRAQTSAGAADAVRAAVLEAELAEWRPRALAAREEVAVLRDRLERADREREHQASSLRDARTRLNVLSGEGEELRAALAAERHARGQAERVAAETEERLAAERAGIAGLTGRLHELMAAASSAAALQARIDELAHELQRERDARAAARRDLAVARYAATAARADVAAGAVARAALERQLRSQGERLTSLEQELDRREAARKSLAAELEAARRPEKPADIGRTAPTRPSREELLRRAREQAEAAASVRSSDDQGRRLAEQLDAAAATLRAAVAPAAGADPAAAAPPEPRKAGPSPLPADPGPPPIPPVSRDVAPAPPPDLPVSRDAPPDPPVSRDAPPDPPVSRGVPPDGLPTPRVSRDAPAGPPSSVAVTVRPAAPVAPAGRRAVTSPVDAGRRSSLRLALIGLARDDPHTAARLLAALLPAQGAFLSTDIDYDLTIRELGTFSVTVAEGRTTVSPLCRPRSRRQAELHLSARALTFAEMLAGRPRRVGRLLAPVRLRGSRRRLAVLRGVAQATPTLSDVVRAGARLEPDLVMRMLPYAVAPAWTKGHSFTVAKEITGAAPEKWYLRAGGAAGLSVSTSPPAGDPDARVSMSRACFDHLLRGEAPPRGNRPSLRGDLAAVELLRTWLDRARC